MGSEKLFENKIKKYLKDQGCWYIKYWAGGGPTVAGVPDILACVNGLFVAIEVKAPNGKPSELQLHTISQIKGAGGVAMVLYPKDFDKFKRIVESIKEHQDRDFSGLWDFGVIQERLP